MELDVLFIQKALDLQYEVIKELQAQLGRYPSLDEVDVAMVAKLPKEPSGTAMH